MLEKKHIVKLCKYTFFLIYSYLPVSEHFFVQPNERMKIVDVLGMKQFLDGERIIAQVKMFFSVHAARTYPVSDLSDLSSGRKGGVFLHCRIWRGQNHDEE